MRRWTTPPSDGGYNARRQVARIRTGEEHQMPEVVVYALGGRSVDQKRALCKDITDAIVKNYKVEPAAVVVTLVETAKTDKAKGGVLFAEMGQK
jgi:4-oxalocrotonate tautomerase